MSLPTSSTAAGLAAGSSDHQQLPIGRSQASAALAAQQYGAILSTFEEHGAQKVQELGIPLYVDELPQKLGMQPVLSPLNIRPQQGNLCDWEKLLQGAYIS